MKSWRWIAAALIGTGISCTPSVSAQAGAAKTVALDSEWKLQDVAKVRPGAEVVSSAAFDVAGWYKAVVPGTVLTTLVTNGVYADPLYGENNRESKIPESLNRTSYWYRTTVAIPKEYDGKHIWLNFEGINYSSQVWVNGKQAGTTRGAFIRGVFDISKLVTPGKNAVVAVLVAPQPHPGIPHEHNWANGVGKNGGESAIDGPTFLSTIGWDWLQPVRDRDTGIWQKAYLSTTGPVTLKDPLVTTDLPLPKTDSTDIAIKADLENLTDEQQKGTIKGSFEGVTFEQSVNLEPHSKKTVSLDPESNSALHVSNPKLWWPNGYGPQNLYHLHLSYEVGGKVSDTRDVTFGVRKITYSVADSENLTISVNGVRVFIRGGNWGLDEALKQVPRERLEAQIRMHQLANLNLIRNWVGQSTNEDFYELCDKYGILVWDEFFQPNPSDGPNPDDIETYIANVRDKILRYRNHPAIMLWCARNEGFPPKEIDDRLRSLMSELEPTRAYQASSTDGHGVMSHGPYHWRTPQEFYTFDEPFKTEIGSMSIPTIESIQGMMPQKDWETINDDWAAHDFAKGAQEGDKYKGILESRYGKIANLADFVRKAQLANYEAFRAMYEGRNAKLFHPSTAIITWMSHPAQPSFVWQLYHHDFEPNSSLFAVKKAGEMVHIQFNENTGNVEVINNRPDPIANGRAHIGVYNLDGSEQYQHDYNVSAMPSLATDLGHVDLPGTLSPVFFIKLALFDQSGKLLSDNFYWRGHEDSLNDLNALNTLPAITLDAAVTREDIGGKTSLAVTLHNPGKTVALMTHLQLHRKRTGDRVLPVFYSDNYVSLLPGESKTVTIEVETAQFKGEQPLVLIDGWNVTVTSSTTSGVSVATNVNAQVDHWPITGLPIMGGVN